MPRLEDLSIEEAEIKTPGGNFTVRGLNSEDLITLLRTHGESLDGLWAALMNQMLGGQEPPQQMTVNALSSLVVTIPALVGDVIALGAGEPGLADKARKLPVLVQLRAVEAIGSMTFMGDNGLESLAETIIRIASGATGLLKGLQGGGLSEIGSTESAGK